ncbi:multidrug resistance efflux transporter family protein [Metabacillus herbersteinensis]|uniref:Multidrug resistance efflux transporter family protein n=1 Tax=Metabacillus herbersteinensis TaxID=283816 RepID=A0ABV6GKW4_9BACI
MKALLLGIISSLFFAVTFILNRSMELSGGSWLWSASLRYFFMLPFLILIVLLSKKMNGLWKEMSQRPIDWLIWSFVGFGLFYAPISFAGAYGPGWLVAGTWSFTIIAGTLLAPLFYERVQTSTGIVNVRGKIPMKPLGASVIVLIGIVFIHGQHIQTIGFSDSLGVILPIVVAAFAYPLGNRKMMELCSGRLDIFQRVLGMTIASLPLWIVLAVYALITVGLPSYNQVVQSFFVAVCSGVIATVLFFSATELVRHDQEKLASVEATQSTQVIFVILGEFFFLAADLPNFLALTGIGLIILGMIVHSYLSRKKGEVVVFDQGEVKTSV